MAGGRRALAGTPGAGGCLLWTGLVDLANGLGREGRRRAVEMRLENARMPYGAEGAAAFREAGAAWLC